ncbi:paraquat-inducible protein A [Mesorhizobium australicum]|uniref:Paraquat-inducible protein A n=1 Tax=Mesorhizobium australicum TaxID=536018 RepID=A0A1X7PLD3_9HYPH|nr:paraquat-inducible protein A [Mesorhizobium australicum]SMH51632.1 paraquat-inducible protein A [Mesorhizobium australicum]
MRFLLPAVLCGATFSFALGITLPLIRVDRFLILSDEPSLVAMVASLWNAGEWAIAGLILVFSIVFPAMKLYLLHTAAFSAADDGHRLPGWFRSLSNWSMLDVVLVALVIFAAKTSGLATAITQPGLWFFAGSVVLTVLAAALVKSRAAAK